MTFLIFGDGHRNSNNKKKTSLKKQQAIAANEYQASQSAVTLQSGHCISQPSVSTLNGYYSSQVALSNLGSSPVPNIMVSQSPPPPIPANSGWQGNSNAGPYMYQHPTFTQSSRINLPVRPNPGQHAQSAPGPFTNYNGSDMNLVTPYPQQKDSRWKSSLNLAKRPVHKASASFSHFGNAASASVTNLSNSTSNSFNHLGNAASTSFHNLNDTLNSKSTAYLNQGAALVDRIANKFDEVITSIDKERFNGNEQDLMVYQPAHTSNSTLQPDSARGMKNPVYPSSSANISGSNHFSKVWLYANSRLPPHLPPLKVYMPTYPLLCLAAQYSERIYVRPTGAERETHVDANWRRGTKAMVLKSVPVDDMNTVVFAIRGSATFMDWAVNFRSEPTSPTGFLDDTGNLCHSGFLHVARQMIAPVSARLRTLLEENPARSNCSLLITGHSAGGAVAALLFAHMMSTSVSSELSCLTDVFKRVHCVTFGAPPISLLPLQKPAGKRHVKSLFFSFINEGDPVPRAADRKVLESLLKLYASPAPNSTCTNLTSVSNVTLPTISSKKSKKPKPSNQSSTTLTTSSSKPEWKIPPGALSTAGRLVLLRNRPGTIGIDDQNVEACVVCDEQLRGRVFGDPLMHQMRIYQRRVEVLATRAVTVRDY